MEKLLLAFLFGCWVGAIAAQFAIRSRLSHLERKLDLLLQQLGVIPTQPPPLSERVQQLARDPQLKIAAIKLYREESGTGLKEAKDAVEAYIATLRQ